MLINAHVVFFFFCRGDKKIAALLGRWQMEVSMCVGCQRRTEEQSLPLMEKGMGGFRVDHAGSWFISKIPEELRKWGVEEERGSFETEADWINIFYKMNKCMNSKDYSNISNIYYFIFHSVYVISLTKTRHKQQHRSFFFFY